MTDALYTNEGAKAEGKFFRFMIFLLSFSHPQQLMTAHHYVASVYGYLSHGDDESHSKERRP